MQFEAQLLEIKGDFTTSLYYLPQLSYNWNDVTFCERHLFSSPERHSLANVCACALETLAKINTSA